MKGIKILGRKSRPVNYSKWEDTEVSSYLAFNMQDYLIEKDSTITGVYFSKKSFSAILAFVNESLETENGEVVPEVGGFLFGKVKQSEADQFEVRVEKFEPVIQPEKNNAIELEMGLSAGIALEKNNEVQNGLMLVGWFHTHPGHTPYLSATDLNKTHNVFFNLPFYIAMVLDSLTPEFDTGIFTRKMNGQMNNAIDFENWMSWKPEITV